MNNKINKQLDLQKYCSDPIPEHKRSDIKGMKCKDCRWCIFNYEADHLKSIICLKRDRNNIVDPNNPACEPNFLKKKKKIYPEWDYQQRKFLTDEEAKGYDPVFVKDFGTVKIKRPVLFRRKKKEEKEN